MRYFVTGVAGFIGSSLVDRLLKLGHTVVGYDNFSSGQERLVEAARTSPAFTLARGDTVDASAITAAMVGCDFVFHFAANADVDADCLKRLVRRRRASRRSVSFRRLQVCYRRRRLFLIMDKLCNVTSMTVRASNQAPALR